MHVTARKGGFFTGRRMPEMGDRMRDVRPTRTAPGVVVIFRLRRPACREAYRGAAW